MTTSSSMAKQSQADTWTPELDQELEQLSADRCVNAAFDGFKKDAIQYPGLTAYYEKSAANRKKFYDKLRSILKLRILKSNNPQPMPVAQAVLPPAAVLPPTAALPATIPPQTLVQGDVFNIQIHGNNNTIALKDLSSQVHNYFGTKNDDGSGVATSNLANRFESASDGSNPAPIFGTAGSTHTQASQQEPAEKEEHQVTGLLSYTQKKQPKQANSVASLGAGVDGVESPMLTAPRMLEPTKMPTRPNPINVPNPSTAPQGDEIVAGEEFAHSPGASSMELSVASSIRARNMPAAPAFLVEYADEVTLAGPPGGVTLNEQAATELLEVWRGKVTHLRKKGLKIRKVTFEGCPLTPAGALVLEPFIKAYVRDDVEYVNLSGTISTNGFAAGQEVIASLCDALYGSKNLRHMVWDKVALSKDGCCTVSKWLENLSVLQSACFDDSAIGAEGAVSLCKALAPFALKNFIVGQSTVVSNSDTSGLEAIGKLIGTQLGLMTVAIPGIRDDISSALLGRTVVAGMALNTFSQPISNKMACNNFVVIDVSDLDLGDDKEGLPSTSARLFGTVVQHAPHLKQLTANRASIGPSGLKSIFEAVQGSGAQLEKVAIEYTEVTPPVAEAIGNCAKKQLGWKGVNFAATGLDDEGLASILNGMQCNMTSIEYLNVSFNDFEEEGFEHCNRFLESVQVGNLSMEGNGLEPDSSVAKSIKNKCSGVVIEIPSAAGFPDQGTLQERLFFGSPMSLNSPAPQSVDDTETSSPVPTVIEPSTSTDVSVAMSMASPLRQVMDPTQLPVIGNRTADSSMTASAVSQVLETSEDAGPVAAVESSVASGATGGPPSGGAARNEAVATGPSTVEDDAVSEAKALELIAAGIRVALPDISEDDLATHLEAAETRYQQLKSFVDQAFGQKNRSEKRKMLFSSLCKIKSQWKAVGAVLGVQVDTTKKKKTALFDDLVRYRLSDDYILSAIPIMMAVMWATMSKEQCKEMFVQEVGKTLAVPDANGILKTLGNINSALLSKQGNVDAIWQAMEDDLAPIGGW